jgi:hypothetical protein
LGQVSFVCRQRTPASRNLSVRRRNAPAVSGRFLRCGETLWQQILRPLAPLYAVARYIPPDVQEPFTRLTGIPIARVPIEGLHSLLNDPDTGIRLPGKLNQSEVKHISLPTIVGQLTDPQVHCVVTFDQSNYRNCGSLSIQRLRKIEALLAEGIHSFFYVSHASFLFAGRTKDGLQRVMSLVQEAGIPSSRLELMK